MELGVVGIDSDSEFADAFRDVRTGNVFSTAPTAAQQQNELDRATVVLAYLSGGIGSLAGVQHVNVSAIQKLKVRMRAVSLKAQLSIWVNRRHANMLFGYRQTGQNIAVTKSGEPSNNSYGQRLQLQLDAPTQMLSAIFDHFYQCNMANVGRAIENAASGRNCTVAIGIGTNM